MPLVSRRRKYFGAAILGLCFAVSLISVMTSNSLSYRDDSVIDSRSVLTRSDQLSSAEASEYVHLNGAKDEDQTKVQEKVPVGSISAGIEGFKDVHAGERCVIIDNGPSLNSMNLTFLNDEITFGANLIYQGFERYGFKPKYYVSVNQKVITQNFDAILENVKVPKFLPDKTEVMEKTGNQAEAREKGVYLFPDQARPKFSTDATKAVYEGYTVNFVSMQLAYYMGCQEVVLIGVDHRHPQTSNLPANEAAYLRAQDAFQNDGRTIIDATLGGALTIFPKRDYTDYFNVAGLPDNAPTTKGGEGQQGKGQEEEKGAAQDPEAILSDGFPAGIEGFKNVHAGERCVIIGNGPSLNSMDLTFLNDYVTFGTNLIYLGFERFGFQPKYYVSVNTNVITQNFETILENVKVPKFLPDKGVIMEKTGNQAEAREKGVYLFPDQARPKFSTDATKAVYEGHTVTFVSMQLAYYMGCQEVSLIGVDHRFSQEGEANKLVVSDGPDPNHFDPNYFGKGVPWQNADLPASEASYQRAKDAYEKDGRRIVDATFGGSLSIFPKRDYREYFNVAGLPGADPEPEAISADGFPERIKGFKNVHAGERCVIIGNGPSLNSMNLTFLNDYVTFGTNLIYLGFERFGFQPKYYVSINKNVITQNFDAIVENVKVPKFLPTKDEIMEKTGDKTEAREKGVFLLPTKSFPRFSYDSSEAVYEGHTVTFVSMQLAYYMGCQEVSLIGVDHRFSQEGEANKLVVSDGPDPNHFDPNYFGKGVAWQNADLPASEASYQRAKDAYENDGRTIIDATLGGALTIFPKRDYTDYFNVAGLPDNAPTTKGGEGQDPEQPEQGGGQGEGQEPERTASDGFPADIEGFKDVHAGERCVIIGNGPSLNSMHLTFLNDYVTFGTNLIYLGFERFGFQPKYYVSVNTNVITQNFETILENVKVPKFLPDKGVIMEKTGNQAEAREKGVYLFPDQARPKFSTDATKAVYEGHTVTFVSMQLAYYMGCQEVSLIGVDHRFSQEGEANKLVVSDGPDPNHFDPNYFGKGVPWQNADLPASEASYQRAKDAYEKDGRRIVDATFGGSLSIFPKRDYREYFNVAGLPGADPEPEAISADGFPERIKGFKDVHAGERCVIIGNGPSLNSMNLTFLNDYVTFGTNLIYLGFERFGFQPKYYVSINKNVITQNFDAIVENVKVPKFLPTKDEIMEKTGDKTEAREKGVFLLPTKSFPRFSYDSSEAVYEGHTVTFVSMQLAYYMGCQEVSLIGVDHRFSQEGEANKLVVSDGPDPNHFDPNYFGKGVAWQNADLPASEASYQRAKDAYEKDGRTIIDATLGGALTIFPKRDYTDYFNVAGLPDNAPTEGGEGQDPEQPEQGGGQGEGQGEKQEPEQEPERTASDGFPADIEGFKNVHAGERCVIIGNGPSLNSMNLTFLNDYVTFGTNLIYLGFERFGFQPKYYVSVNTNVITQNFETILENVKVPKFLPDKGVIMKKTGNQAEAREKGVYLFPDQARPKFSTDATKAVYEGHTVTFVSMQLAYYMGCQEVSLIGVDHRFSQEGEANKLVVSDGPDPNHFDPNYFGKGVPWQNADLPASEASYQRAKDAYEKDGRRIVDATFGGSLSIFPKRDYREYFNVAGLPGADPEPEAISADGFPERIKGFKDVHAGERCVIIGNGPSLNSMNLTFLNDYVTFGTNLIYLGFERFGFQPKYYVSINKNVITQNFDAIVENVKVPKFLPTKDEIMEKTGDKTEAREKGVFLLPTKSFPRFSYDSSEAVYEGHTVTFVSMQLAYYMGCQEVSLIGVDHRFSQEGEANKLVVSDGPDPNHFDPNYFGKGVAWQNADLPASEASYQRAKDAYEKDGRTIIDATLGGALTIFPKRDYTDYFNVAGLPDNAPTEGGEGQDSGSSVEPNALRGSTPGGGGLEGRR